MDIVITNAGLAEIVNAEKNGTAPVVLSQIAFGTGQYKATADQTALQAEFKRIDAIAGGGIGDNLLHITTEDKSDDSYSVYEVGVYTASGTLFAVYSQNTPIIEKAEKSTANIVIDILLTEANPESVSFGETSYNLASSTTETQGIVELATIDETKAGTDSTRAITPLGFKKALDDTSNSVVHKSGNETIAGDKDFTGTITAPTPTDANDSSTKIATTKWVSDKASKYLPLAGGKMTGALILENYVEIKRDSTDKYTYVYGGQSRLNGAYILVCGKDYDNGYFEIASTNGTAKTILKGTPDETLTWCGKNIVRSVNDTKADEGGNVNLGAISTRAVGITSAVDLNDYRTAGQYICNQTVTGRECSNNPTGGAFALTVISKYASNPNIVYQYITGFTHQDVYVRRFYTDSNGSSWTVWKKLSDCLPLDGGTMTGTVRAGLEGFIVSDTDDKAVRISGGTGWDNGASFVAYGKEHETYGGMFRIKATDGTTGYILLGKPDGTLTWNGKPIVVLVDSWKDSSDNWYRKYSDGWIEQGGIVSYDVLTSKEEQITLPIAFSNANYTFLITMKNKAHTYTDGMNIQYREKSKTYAKVYITDGDGFDWYACGF